MIEYPKNRWKKFFNKNNNDIEQIIKHVEEKELELKPLKRFPCDEHIFRAFQLCDIKKIKVVILGQDCYHGEGQANGLCFSVNEDVKHPPSLRNILKEMKSDIGEERKSSDFTSLAEQGVLFLNSSLTVTEKLAGSHIEFWEKFTDKVIRYISKKRENIVFILWGNYAIDKSKFIDKEKHYIISGKHPSPLSANRGGFFGEKYFSKCNEILKSKNIKEIDWLN
uniref:Uracil-DNA glycosylase-like domain-containing protein n=1 Tax=viral metagenome TaxID=1070528 RepID=A0A6C0JEZ2_9ZZZZ